MAKNQTYVTYEVVIWDRILRETVNVTRRVEEGEGYHHFGRISYRGERLRLVSSPGGGHMQGRGADSEDYPPRLHKCKTQRAKDWWAANPKH